jgi:diadenosine tetraphosphate (Ap4A) HIT family hydrolase
MFELHPQLVKDCIVVDELPLSTVLLANDSNYPWLILVPRREDVREIFQLQLSDQRQLLIETSAVSAAMASYYQAEKMNVAALGNMVPQLHVHLIARYQTDPAWPRPVWGAIATNPYTQRELEDRLQQVYQLVNSCKIEPVFA